MCHETLKCSRFSPWISSLPMLTPLVISSCLVILQPVDISRPPSSYLQLWITHSYSAATRVLWVSPGLSGEESEYIGGGGSFALNTLNIFGQVDWLFGSWVFQFLKWESLNFVWLFTTLRTEACQASLTFTISWSLLKLMSTELVMLSNLIFTVCKGKNEGVGNKQAQDPTASQVNSIKHLEKS